MTHVILTQSGVIPKRWKTNGADGFDLSDVLVTGYKTSKCSAAI